MRIAATILAVLVAACTTASPADLDTDPSNLQIEIGRYGALMAQVAEYTNIPYEPIVIDVAEEGAEVLWNDLREAIAEYNMVRETLCASRTGASTYVDIRTRSCGVRLDLAMGRRDNPSYAQIARHSREAGGPIIALWSEVCAEARRLERDPEVMVCPME